MKAEDISIHYFVRTRSVVTKYCLPATVTREKVETLAEKDNLPEMPPQNARYFSHDGGRAFAIPDHMGNIVLVSNKNGVCSVATRELNADKFWTEIDEWFGPKTPFKLISSDKKGDSTTKIFEADFKGKVSTFISAHDKPINGQMQSLISVAHMK